MNDIGFPAHARDEFGRPRRGVVLGRDGLPIPNHTGPLLDGQTMHLPMMLMDTQTQAGVSAMNARQQALAEMCDRQSRAWSHDPASAPRQRLAGPSPLQWQPPTMTDTEAGSHAAQRHVAHAEMVARNADAWRGSAAPVAPARPTMTDADRRDDRAAAHREMIERNANAWRTGGRVA